MRKEIVGTDSVSERKPAQTWLDLASIARVQITSEDPAFPIENALNGVADNEAGWRAATTGPQTISILFDAPQEIRRISLHFVELKQERSQEFLLRYTSGKETNREIVRQQWTFSPHGSAQQREDYTVELHEVTKLELLIDPDRGRLQNVATLHSLRLA